jgi:hypothetical protein
VTRLSDCASAPLAAVKIKKIATAAPRKRDMNERFFAALVLPTASIGIDAAVSTDKSAVSPDLQRARSMVPPETPPRNTRLRRLNETNRSLVLPGRVVPYGTMTNLFTL